jgi:spore maturation protein CgeB
MKFQFLTSYYTPFLASFYKDNPQFLSLSYNEMFELLMDQYFADTGAAYFYLRKHKQDSFIIISNCEPLQKQWALENGVDYSEMNWQMEIAFAQVKWYKPDVFYLESVFEYFGGFIGEIRAFCKYIVSWISTPFSASLQLNGIDLFLSSTPDFIDSFRKQGFKAEYMLPAFDSRILKQINNPKQKDISFSFVGGWSEIHVNRKNALQQLVSTTPIELWGYGYKKTYSRRKLDYYKNWLFPKNKDIVKRYNGEVWGLKMFDILQRSLITFNIHESLLKGNVGNMRMFEATGVGTLILNDFGHNLNSLFEVGKEVESYRSIPEAIEKCYYFMTNPEKAMKIGEMAQIRTLKDYNYDIYVVSLISYIDKIDR